MDRQAILRMLVLSIRTNGREISGVLEELNRGARERTYPNTLARCFRTIEHDARAAGLNKFADVVAAAKDASAAALDRTHGQELVEVFSEAVAEFQRAADDLEKGRPHPLDEKVKVRLQAAAGWSKGSEPRLSPS